MRRASDGQGFIIPTDGLTAFGAGVAAASGLTSDQTVVATPDVTGDKIRSLIHNRAAESKIFVAAEAAGLRTMRADGQRLIDEGITSEAEVLSVTRD